MLRKLFFSVHKWLGLATGVIVLIVSITGCINVFADEFREFFYPDRFFSGQVVSQPVMNFSDLRKNAQKALGPEYKLSRCEVYPEPGRNWIFRATSTDPKGFGHWNYYKYYYRIYINPHTGRVVHVEDTRNEFFQLVLNIHMNLLLGKPVGGVITGISCLTFLALLLSGLFLWWPKKWKVKNFKKGLLLKANASSKRRNYDLHNVLGFYTLVPAMLICITGLVFAFEWADNAVQYAVNGGRTVEKRTIPLSSPNEGYRPEAIDGTVATLLRLHPQADVFSIRFRDKTTDPLDVQVRLAEKRTHLFKWYYFDRNSGKLLLKYGHEDVKGGEKFRSMNYDLHTGAFSGLPTKLLAFFVSLICASLPVTGFMIWYNRTKGKGKKTERRMTVSPKQTLI
jgi:uncharacterized iron-regulated membrane protein